MSVIEIVFSNESEMPGEDRESGEEFPLFFTTSDVPPARTWLRFLRDEVAKQAPVESHFLKNGKVRGRFTGFPSHQKSGRDLASLINQCIDTVNAYSADAIPLRATDTADQQELNELHKYFEIHRGPRLEPGEIFLNGTPEVRRALEDFNLLIHEFESYNASNQAENGCLAHLDVTFEKNWVRHPFAPQDYQYFDPARDFGGLYLHYCDVGKPLLDAFFDNDEVVGMGNIRPLQFISADFDVFFGKPTKKLFDLDFKKRFQAWVSKMGLDPSDPKLSIGYVKVGQLIPDTRIRWIDQPDFLRMISPYLNVKRIAIHD